MHALEGSKEPKPILNRVSGSAEPGKMLAVMGASGAGKSTLLDTLFGRLNKKQYQVTGSIKSYRHQSNDSLPLKNDDSLFVNPDDVSYVYQEDLFVESLTPEEHLTFAANFCFQRKKSKKEVSLLVDDLLMKMRLNKSRHTVIGNSK